MLPGKASISRLGKGRHLEKGGNVGVIGRRSYLDGSVVSNKQLAMPNRSQPIHDLLARQPSYRLMRDRAHLLEIEWKRPRIVEAAEERVRHRRIPTKLSITVNVRVSVPQSYSVSDVLFRATLYSYVVRSHICFIMGMTRPETSLRKV